MRRTRFAPSPTGPLHLGHAFSALTAFDRADPGEFLVRIEDIDRSRCRPDWETAIHDDLRWLGLSYPPALRQSDRSAAYAEALERLSAKGLLYPCRCSRADVRALSAPQEGAPLTGPDGLVYPGTCRDRALPAGPGEALRINMSIASQHIESVEFIETGTRAGQHAMSVAAMAQSIGDVVLSRPGWGCSYHLAVVVDDAAQGITEVVRGEDLFEATFIHVLLQKLLQLPTPSYHHHRLIRDETGKRLAKRDDARALALFRRDGATPEDLRQLLGLPA